MHPFDGIQFVQSIPVRYSICICIEYTRFAGSCSDNSHKLQSLRTYSERDTVGVLCVSRGLVCKYCWTKIQQRLESPLRDSKRDDLSCARIHAHRLQTP